MGWVRNVRRVAAAAAEACKRDGVSDPDQARAVLHAALAEHVHPVKVGGWLQTLSRPITYVHGTYGMLLCARHTGVVVVPGEDRGGAALRGPVRGKSAEVAGCRLQRHGCCAS